MRLNVRILASLALFLFSISLFLSILTFTDQSDAISEEIDIEKVERIINEFDTNLHFTTISKHSIAFFTIEDGRNGNMGYPYIRILILARGKRTFKCKIKNEISDGKLYTMSENHMKPFGVHFINCHIPVGISMINSIEIMETTSSSLWVTLPITYSIPDEHTVIKYSKEYSICVPYLFGSRYDKRRFIEFMEFNRILGVEYVTLYTDILSLSSDLKKTLEFYQNKGILQVLNVQLPVNDGAIWYHGQLLFITDCLYRHVGVSKFVAFHDLDEFIVPSKTLTAIETIKDLFNSSMGAIRIPTQYFVTKNEEPPITLNEFNATLQIDSTFTKCVVRPERVFEQGIHHTSRVIQDNYDITPVKASDLLLYHYKNRAFGKIRKDDTIKTIYGATLQKAYQSTLNQL